MYNYFFPTSILVVITLFLSGCDSDSHVEVNTSDLIDLKSVHATQRTVHTTQRTGDNLLANPDFEQPLGALPGWSACNSSSNLIAGTYAGGTDSTMIEVKPGDCILQAVAISPGEHLDLVCDIYTDSKRKWTGLGLTYYSSDLDILAEQVVSPDKRRRVIRRGVSETAPDGSSIALAWFYTDAQESRIDNCSLTVESTDSGKQIYTKTTYIDKTYSGTITPYYYPGWPGWISGLSEMTLIDGIQHSYGTTYLYANLDSEYLYLLVSTSKGPTAFGLPRDDSHVMEDSYPVNGQLWNDDSFEIYFNTGNENTVGYDANDFLRIYGFSYSLRYYPVTVTGDNSQLNLTDDVYCFQDQYVGSNCFLKYSLAELGVAGMDVAEIGFDIQYNFDDDGGERESKYSRCGEHTLDAWKDMSKITCSLILRQNPPSQ